MNAVLKNFESSMVAAGQAPLPAIPDRAAQPPVQYERAISALVACRTIDDARQWTSAADALAAWAKVYADDRVAREARMLKLHAYRRIGLLADELAREKPRSPAGRPCSGNHVLTQHGFNGSQKLAIRRLTKLPEKAFDELANDPSPKAPSTLSVVKLTPAPKYRSISHALGSLLAKMRQFTPAEVAADMTAANRPTASRNAIEASAWLEDLVHAIKELG